MRTECPPYIVETKAHVALSQTYDTRVTVNVVGEQVAWGRTQHRGGPRPARLHVYQCWEEESVAA